MKPCVHDLVLVLIGELERAGYLGLERLDEIDVRDTSRSLRERLRTRDPQRDLRDVSRPTVGERRVRVRQL